MRASIIIPCFNEEKNIIKLVERFKTIALSNMVDLELVLVDNGSKDGTIDEIMKVADQNKFVKPVKVEVNQGYGFGILSGLKEANGDWLGWMHADLQSDPEIFIEMFRSAINEDGDFLYKGKRKNRPIVDTLFTIGMSCFETIYLGTRLWDINAQPTLLSKKYYQTWTNPPYDFSLDLFTYYMAKKQNIRIKRFESVQRVRENGVSSWNTGMKARIKLVKRVLAYSKEMKNYR